MRFKNQIQPDQWESYICRFAQGRLTQLESNIDRQSVQVLESNLPLKDITLSYTPKGSMLIIAVGNGKRELTHVIDSPIDIWESPNIMGQVASFEILNKNLDVTVVKLLD
jgi:hypothetical protein